MGNHMSNPVTDKETQRGYKGDITFAASGMKGWRVTMEDCRTMCSTIVVDTKSNSKNRGNGDKNNNTNMVADAEEVVLNDHCLFCVYDGHGGGFTSSYAGLHFVRILSSRSEMKEYALLPDKGNRGKNDVNGIALLKDALVGTFQDIDQELRMDQESQNQQIFTSSTKHDREKSQRRVYEIARAGGEATSPYHYERSGATCIVVLLTPSHIICANAGDSRAMLRRQGGQTFPLSFDHKPSNVVELERVHDAGGFVAKKRVNGDLAVSRGLGDFAFKSDVRIANHKQQVICTPDLHVYPREATKDEFIVLACDGVWDVVSSDECATMIQEIMDEGETDIGLVCEEVLDQCLFKNSRDNMTMVMVSLPAIQMQTDHLSKRSAVWARRASRKAKEMEGSAKAVVEGVMSPTAACTNPVPMWPSPARSTSPTATSLTHTDTTIPKVTRNLTPTPNSTVLSPESRNDRSNKESCRTRT